MAHVDSNMVIALICVLSMAALGQFVIFYWRAVVSVVAAAPLSDRVRQAAGVQGESVSPRDFAAFLNLHHICPELKSGGLNIAMVRAYYAAVDLLARLTGNGLHNWAQQEMVTCSRYVAVRLDQRIEHNRTFWAQIRAH